jgi:hypothetical protein
MPKESIRVEASGTVAKRPKLAVASSLIEPRYHFLNQESISDGMGLLKAQLSYESAVADMHLNNGNLKGKLARAYLEDANDEIQVIGKEETIKVDNYIKGENRNLSILESQTKFFNSVAATNILADYQNRIFTEEQNHLNENPYGEGHLNHMVQFHNSIVKDCLGNILDPEMKASLINHFGNAGSRVASRAFDQEQTRRTAKAEIELENAVSNATLLIDKGISVDSAIQTLEPIMQSIPDSMPWKAKAFYKIRKDIIHYGAAKMAFENPSLLEANIQRGGLFSELNTEQRNDVLNKALLSKNAIAADILKQQDEQRLIGNLMQAGAVSGIKTQISNGEFGIKELEAVKEGMSEKEYQYLLKHMDKVRKVKIAESIDLVLASETLREEGNYHSLSSDQQKKCWIQTLASQKFMYNGEAAVDSANLNDLLASAQNGAFVSDTIMRAQSEEAEKYNVYLEPYKNELMKRIFNGSPSQVSDAVEAFNRTYVNNRKVLGADGPEVKAMVSFSEGLSRGYSIEKSRDLAQSTLLPMSKEERMALNNSYRTTELNTNIVDVLNQSGVYVKEGRDDKVIRYAKSLAKREYIRNRGDEALTRQIVNSEIKMNCMPSSVNGSAASDYVMIAAPESFICQSGYKEDALRSSFNRTLYSKVEKAMDVEGSGVINVNLGNQITLIRPEHPEYKGDINECVITNSGESKKGYYWYVSSERDPRKYHIRYNEYETTLFGAWTFSPVFGDNCGYLIMDPETHLPLELSIDDLSTPSEVISIGSEWE